MWRAAFFLRQIGRQIKGTGLKASLAMVGLCQTVKPPCKNKLMGHDMKKLLWAALALALTACGLDTPSPSARFDAAEGYWQQNAAGGQHHVPSDILFPERIGDYVRVRLHDFRPDGRDVGVVYQNPGLTSEGRPAELTLYVTYSKGGTAEQYADSAVQAIVQRWSDVEKVQYGVFTPETGSPAAGPFRLYRVYLGGSMARTGVWTSRKGDWLLKARFTYPEEVDKAMTLLRQGLNQTLAEQGADQQVSIITRDKEGVAPDMQHVTAALKDVIWSTQF